MLKFIAGLMFGLIIGTWVGAAIVHREYYPILKEQTQEIETLLNTREKEIRKVKESLELCKEDYIKQYKNGMDFVIITLGIKEINPQIKEKQNERK